MKYFWLFLLWLSSLFLLQGCGSTPVSDTPPVPVAKEDARQGDEVKEEVDQADEEIDQQIWALPTWTTKVLIETDFGNMEAVLYDNTPGHRDNFVKLVEEWYYDDLLFHRVIEGFMIQGGDPDSRGAPAGTSLGRWWPDYKLDAEIWEVHYKGTLAAARQWWAINPEKKSSGSQFYISHGWPVGDAELTRYASQKWSPYTDAQVARYAEVGWIPMLDGEYTVFGEVTAGLEVIDAIAAVNTASADRPVEDVTMKISLIE